MTGVVDERGVEYTPPSRGKSLAENAWDELDKHIDSLMAAFAADDKPTMQLEQGWCQALCWTIHTWTPHYYKTPDEVKAHAAVRREIRLGQRDFEPTPGYQYNPMPPSHKDFARINKKAYMPSEAAKDEAAAATPARKTGPKPPTEEQIKLIKQAMDMFGDADEVSRVLNIDVNIVKSVV
jgi:hypothetical protein